MPQLSDPEDSPRQSKRSRVRCMCIAGSLMFYEIYVKCHRLVALGLRLSPGFRYLWVEWIPVSGYTQIPVVPGARVNLGHRAYPGLA